MTLPRILTLDPTGVAARLVHAVIDLTEQTIIQTDVPTVEIALAELERSPYDLVVSALELYHEMDGVTLAMQVQAALPDTRFIVIGGSDVENTFDERITLLSRPLDPQVFLQVLIAGATGASMLPRPTAEISAPAVNFGPVPTLSLSGVTTIIDTLMTDVPALGLLLVTREGEVLLERGANRQLNRDDVAQALLPAMTATIHMGALVGGKIATMHFYDGDKYDIFVLGIGYHHFLCLVFDGKYGAKQIGAVRTYALRAAQDISALLGAQAYTVQTPSKQGRGRTRRAAPVQESALPAAPISTPQEQAPLLDVEAPSPNGHIPEEEVESYTASTPRVVLEPIEDFDPSLLDQLSALDSADADDLFDLDKIAEMAKDAAANGNLVSGDDAVKRGFVQ
jgi:hypothetical protein